MKRERIIADLSSTEDARKVEETVKTGYAEPVIESILNWIAVEEDLVSSYEGLAREPSQRPNQQLFEDLAKESRRTLDSLAGVQRSVESLDSAQVKRVERLKKA
jgi:hypothetical protein